MLSGSSMSNLPKQIACYRDCNLCSLGSRSLHRTLYRGSFPSPILVIGEGPGEDEDTLGVPLVGRSGQLWWQVVRECLDIAKSRLTLEDFAATNIVACVPYNEDRSRTFNQYRQPSLPEIEACRPRLLDTLRLAQPKAVITIGTVAKVQTNKAMKLVWTKGKLPARLSLSHPAHWARRGGIEGVDANAAKIALCQFLLESKKWLADDPVLLVPSPPKKPNTGKSGKGPKNTASRTRA